MADADKIRTIEQLHMFTKVGTVAEGQSWLEKTVRSTTTSGGTTISSSTAEKLRLFVRGDDGEEFEVMFSDPGFGVREGHRVSVVCGKNQAETLGYAMALANHSTGQAKVFAERIRSIVDGVGDLRGCLLLASPVFILIFLAAFLGPLAFIPAAIPVIWFVGKYRRGRALAKKITAVVSEELQKAIEAERRRVATG